jgi:biofilm PGA synthesis N-glycosyltransferase PgaC
VRVGIRESATWACGAGATWILGGYPAALALLPPRPWRIGGAQPTVTVLVPTYRERELLTGKLRSLAALDYPPDRVQIVVIADGDRRVADIARTALPQAEVLLQEERQGKPAALNRGLEIAAGEIVLLTDAHTPLASASLASAVRHFADPQVTGVSGRWAETGSAYDAYEHVLRSLESRCGSTAGVFGGFFAVRRAAIGRFPSGVVNDDLWLLCRLVRAGGRVVYEPAALSEEAALPAEMELERRARIAAGRAMLVAELAGLPWGFRWRLLTHKYGRLVLPFLLIGALGSSLTLVRRPAYRALAAAQLAVYAVGALAAAGITPPPPARRPANAARQFVLGNVATVRGVIRAARRRQHVRWQAVR